MNEQQFSTEFNLLFKVISQKEDEDTWQNIEHGIGQLATLTISAGLLPAYTLALKGPIKHNIINCILTERTKLSRSALNLIATMARAIGSGFNALGSVYIPSVLKLTARANKVYITGATATLKECIAYSGLAASLPGFISGLESQSKTMRIACISCIVCISKSVDAGFTDFSALERAIVASVSDASPEVRVLSKELFTVYQQQAPSVGA